MSSFLKSNLENDITNVTEIELDEDKSIHQYSGCGCHSAEEPLKFIFKFSNETAWYHNKYIDIKLRVQESSGDDREVVVATPDEGTIMNRCDASGNAFLIENISYKAGFSVDLNKSDIIYWDFAVQNKNSIDFKIFYQLDYQQVVRNKLAEIDILKDEVESKKLYIDDLEKKIEDKDNIIKDKECIMREYNTIADNKNRSFKYKDELIKKKDAVIKRLEGSIKSKDFSIQELSKKVDDLKSKLNKNGGRKDNYINFDKTFDPFFNIRTNTNKPQSKYPVYKKFY